MAIVPKRIQPEAEFDDYRVLLDDKGKLVLPSTPAADDIAGLCRWLTAVFNRDPAHPIVAGHWQGLAGPMGHVELERRGAPSIRFEPVKAINTPARLVETLSWQRVQTDGELYAYKTEHCRQIAWVVGSLCSSTSAETEREETIDIITAFLAGAVAVEGFTTHGTSGQRYEAVEALKRGTDDYLGRPMGPYKYLIDAGTGELVIAASDLEASARAQLGLSLDRGWLRARIEAIGWQRIELQGYALAGRTGRTGPHARRLAVRGLVPREEPELFTEEGATNER